MPGLKMVKNANEKSADIYIYEDIGEGWFGGFTALQFKAELDELGDVETLNVYINSPGGDVFDGVAIYNQLRRHKAKVVVEIDALAASIASLIAMAGDEIYMAENALLMIHDPWAMAIGTERDMLKVAEDLRLVKNATLVSTYVKRTGLKASKISEMMAEETWMSAAEARENKFIDDVTAEKRMAAHIDLKKYNFLKMPEAYKDRAAKPAKPANTDLIQKWLRHIATR